MAKLQAKRGRLVHDGQVSEANAELIRPFCLGL